jgi:hypothetical protein
MTDVDAAISQNFANNDFSDEEKHRISKMFEMLQVPIIKYIEYLVQESGHGLPLKYEDLFKLPELSTLPNAPIVLRNVNDLKDKYIHITFNLEDDDDSRPTNFREHIPDDEMWSYITSMVNDGANMIWNYYIEDIIKCPQNKEFLKRISLSLDLDTLTFVPVVLSTARRTLSILYDILHNLMYFKTTPDKNTGLIMYNMLPEEKRAEIEESEQRLRQEIEETKESFSIQEEFLCEDIQKKLMTMKKLVANCKIVELNELPLQMQTAVVVEKTDITSNVTQLLDKNNPNKPTNFQDMFESVKKQFVEDMDRNDENSGFLHMLKESMGMGTDSVSKELTEEDYKELKCAINKYMDSKEQSSAPAEDVPAEVAPVEVAPAEDAPAEVVPAEVVPAEVVPAEDAPAEVVPAEVVPAEVVPAEVAPAEVAPAEDASAEVVPAEVAPAEVAPAEVAPAEVVPAEVAPAEVAPAEVAPAEDAPAEVAPAEDAPAEVAPADK